MARSSASSPNRGGIAIVVAMLAGAGVGLLADLNRWGMVLVCGAVYAVVHVGLHLARFPAERPSPEGVSAAERQDGNLRRNRTVH